ncbi:MAG: DUF1127 domain-containing protein [Bosea sp.]|uniref:DUF1127 domain-containing protein n=1 Tax=Bosea sp. (in: a-proteobacteria) TaxID=1871050 RepID=UPI0023A0263A|nr:DUF1127 domain-containing protein [Bosea sp. (in: a-proteobacteria)]MCP4736548.1 DUF1127 domain-containing protein [Bosea sp. (in: a-proteobacteria)]
MNDAPTLARSPQTSSKGMLAIWQERIRARWKLAQMAQENPHLLKDIGLTKQQVETEIAKRFWQR